MTDAERAVIELAAAQLCPNRFSDDLCGSKECLHCMAAVLLPELRCACGKWELDRAYPSLYEKPIYHYPDVCAEPTPPTHCSSCQQPLRPSVLPPSAPTP